MTSLALSGGAVEQANADQLGVDRDRPSGLLRLEAGARSAALIADRDASIPFQSRRAEQTSGRSAENVHGQICERSSTLRDQKLHDLQRNADAYGREKNVCQLGQAITCNGCKPDQDSVTEKM